VLVRTSRLEDNPDRWALPARITAGLSFALGLVGLLLASIGIYGVMSYAVAQWTREIGIRMTLGAEQRDVARMVLRQSMRPVAIGVAIGLAGSAAVSQLLSSLLFGVSPLDPTVFGAWPRSLERSRW
jgi:ABC-type antimicrobial peptide transport system permease subunit